MAGRMAVFLDRDGVICVNRSNYVRQWSDFVWLPGSREAIVRLYNSGIPVFVATNQSIINRGLVTVETLHGIHARMVDGILAAGGDIAQVYYCPHAPGETCVCRKPEPGMLLRASQEHRIDLLSSYMVGDYWSDIACGKNAGAKTILVTTDMPYEEYLRTPNGSLNRPDHACAGLPEAVDLILSLTGLSE